MSKRALVPNALKVKGINVRLDDPIDLRKASLILPERPTPPRARFSVPDGHCVQGHLNWSPR